MEEERRRVCREIERVQREWRWERSPELPPSNQRETEHEPIGVLDVTRGEWYFLSD